MRTARPLIDAASAIAPDRSLIGRRAFDRAVRFVEAQLSWSTVAEVSWRYRMLVAPKADLCLSGSILGCGVSLPVGGCLLGLELLVVPSHPGLDLIEANVVVIWR